MYKKAIPKFPIEAIYRHEAYLGTHRAAKLAIWQILAFWWCNSCKPLPDDMVLMDLSGLRAREWYMYADSVKTALSELMPRLAVLHAKETAAAKVRSNNLVSARQAHKVKQTLTNSQNKKNMGMTDKPKAMQGDFTAIKPAGRAFHEGWNNEAERAFAKESMNARSGEKVTFTDKPKA